MTDDRGPVAEALRNLRHGGPSVVLELLARTYLRYGRSLDGTNPFDRDWDLLVVLDACRADLLAEVADEYAFLDDPGTVTSVGATSTEWLEGTFGTADDETLAGTTYVTGNPYSAGALDADRLGAVDEVWRYAWDDDLGTIPARPITDRAVAHARERDPDRLVVHYMQPHFPVVPDAENGAEFGVELDAFGDRSIGVWEELRFGRRERSEAWARYRENLRYVLAEVELLLANVDAEAAVVTADHGNAFGEWHLWGHAAGVALPAMRAVPWYVTEGSDGGGHEPAEYDGARDVAGWNGGDDRRGGGGGRERAGDETDEISRRLEQLGYR